MLLFGKGTIEEWVKYKEIMDCFCAATCMKVSREKSFFLEWGLEETDRRWVRELFSMEIKPLDSGLKYLGYY